MKRRSFVFWIFAAFAFPANAGADELPLETAIKATYLYKFAPFVDWPPTAFATPSSPFQLCILGDDPFGGALEEAVAGQRIGARAIAVLRFKNPRAATGFHILYIGDASARTAVSALDALHGAPVLTVTDLSAGAPTHGVINFIIESNHVRFDIDDAAAARNGLVISSKLLQLAHAVKPRAGE